MVGLPGVRTARAALLTAAASGDWDTAISSVAPLLEGGAAQGEILNQLLLPTQVEAGAAGTPTAGEWSRNACARPRASRY